MWSRRQYVLQLLDPPYEPGLGLRVKVKVY